MAHKAPTFTPSESERFARIARDRAQRRAALWALPILSDEECAEALALPHSTLQWLKARREAPETFTIGRRVYVKTDALRAWLDRRASAESA